MESPPLIGIAVLALLFTYVVLERMKRKRRRKEVIRGAARRIYCMKKVLFSDRHEIRPVRPEDFRDLDFAFYDNSQKRLEDLGFVFLGDFEDHTLNAYRDLRALPTFLRALTRPDEAITAAVYHSKQVCIVLPRGGGEPLWRESRVIDFSTALNDGTAVITSNADLAALTDEIPGRLRRFLPRGATADDLLAAHRDHVASVLADKPGASPLPIRTIEEYIEE